MVCDRKIDIVLDVIRLRWKVEDEKKHCSICVCVSIQYSAWICLITWMTASALISRDSNRNQDCNQFIPISRNIYNNFHRTLITNKFINISKQLISLFLLFLVTAETIDSPQKPDSARKCKWFLQNQFFIYKFKQKLHLPMSQWPFVSQPSIQSHRIQSVFGI